MPQSQAPKNHPLSQYPRITLNCGECGNEFHLNVMRFSQGEPVCCQVCGAIFPKEIGQQFAHSLELLFQTKHQLELSKSRFNLSFVYKSTFKQPPAPYAFTSSDFSEDHPSYQAES